MGSPPRFALLLPPVVVAAIIIASHTAAAADAHCSFPAIFNFGDSNSDTGGLSALFGQLPSPAGETYFRKPAGRSCDGRLIIDFIAQSLGLPYLRAYLDAVGSNFSHGANFATSGSTIRPQNTTWLQSGYSPVSLDFQFNQFYDFRRRSQVARAQDPVYEKMLPKEEAFSKGLYTFDIGQNDLTAGYFLNKSTHQVRAYIPQLLSNFKNIVKRIYDEGGRYFWIHNTGPVGCLAYVIDRIPVLASQVDRAGCAAPFNQVAQDFNAGLKDAVAQLRNELPEAALTYVDVYSVKYSLIANPNKYGFSEAIRACCGYGGKFNYNVKHGCGYKSVVNGKEVILAKSCKDPTVHVNWDGIHFTEAANKQIFNHIVAGSFSDNKALLNMACHKI